MRVLLAPVGTRGDVAPLAALGAALVGRGHEVTACVTRDFADLLAPNGISCRVADLDASDFAQHLGTTLWATLAVGRKLRPAAEVLARALDEACRDVDVVVGSGFQLLAPVFCEARAIPFVMATVAPVAERSRAHPPAFVPLFGFGPWTNAALWRGQEAVIERLLGRQVAGIRARLGRQGSRRQALLGFLQPGAFLRLYDAPLVDAAYRREAIGACAAFGPQGPLPRHVQEFLRAGPPPVVVSFGSMPAADPRARAALVVDSLRAHGLRAVLDRGWGGLLGEASVDDVCWVAGVDHRSLFPHAAAVVHHGGPGTMAVAARAGVPQIVVPHMVDQFYWGRRTEALGIGPRAIPARRLTRRRFSAALAAVTDAGAERFRRRAEQLALELAPIDGPERAADALEQHVAVLGALR